MCRTLASDFDARARFSEGDEETKSGVALDPESEVLPLIDSKEDVFHLPVAFVDPGTVVLVPDPGYPLCLGTVAREDPERGLRFGPAGGHRCFRLSWRGLQSHHLEPPRGVVLLSLFSLSSLLP